MTLDDLFDALWREYAAITPDAHEIHRRIAERGETIVNDHVAFRTFDIDPIRIDSLVRPFIDRGYRPSGEYSFEEKKLRARSYMHEDPTRPRIFISELLTGSFSDRLKAICRSLAEQVPPGRAGSTPLFMEGRIWSPVSHDEYLGLLEESEYAAWTAAFGIRVNHFTVSFNHLKGFESLRQFCDWLASCGFRLLDPSDPVSGSPDVLLEQASILASRIEWEFAGGERKVIPSCYYEFARRYVDPSTGKLYAGFIAKSANKLFESTNVKPYGRES
ncbi:MAG: DUF1338 domain-containing protein [Candidatus Eisenbacteria bacterium]|nr:DUF1338 domain-containing protein [Candidatus Eisenbacteria bacterium]